MSRPIAVFDLDGTLVDTAPDLIAALNVVLAAEHLAPVPDELGRSMIGHGAKAMIAAGVRHHGMPATEERLAPMFERFLEHYAANIAAGSRPFPGAEAALDRLAGAGALLAVCTNKLEGLSRLLLDELGLAGRFAAVVGQDTLGVRKPDPAHVAGTVERAGGDIRRAVMVGDSALDVTAARGAGVTAIAVTFGYSDRPAGELDADIVMSHYDELWDAAAPRLGLAGAPSRPPGRTVA
jgi:phosphoglycolate phosphatase